MSVEGLSFTPPVKSDAYVLPSDTKAKAAKPQTRIQLIYKSRIAEGVFNHNELIDNKKVLNIRSKERVYKEMPSLSLLSKLFHSRVKIGDAWIIVNKESLRKRMGMTKDEFKQINKNGVIDTFELESRLLKLTAQQNNAEYMISRLEKAKTVKQFNTAFKTMSGFLNDKNHFDPQTRKALETLRNRNAEGIKQVVEEKLSLPAEAEALLISEIKKATAEIKSNLWWNPS